MEEFERSFENQQSSQDRLEGQDYFDTKEVKPVNITYEDVKEIELDLTSENLVYKGEGATSSASKYDKDKADWLRSIGVEVSEHESSNGILTAFNIVRNLIVLRAIYEANMELEGDSGEEDTQRAIYYVNLRLQKNRIDEVGNREIVIRRTGSSYEEIASKFNFNSNPEKRVSIIEYNTLLKGVLDSLKK